MLREFRAANADLIALCDVRGTIQHEGQSDRHVEASQMTDEEFEASIADGPSDAWAAHSDTQGHGSSDRDLSRMNGLAHAWPVLQFELDMSHAGAVADLPAQDAARGQTN